MKRIITIGREFGAGGRDLGRRLARELGIAYYDRDAFLLSWAWIALSIFATFLTLDLGTTENTFR